MPACSALLGLLPVRMTCLPNVVLLSTTAIRMKMTMGMIAAMGMMVFPIWMPVRVESRESSRGPPETV